MKNRWVLIGVLALGFFMAFHFPIHAEKMPRTLTLIYSNNLNGEIDPCPT